ncbi:Arsenate reductase related protein [Prochlorococcus sp. MIT 0603]|nr:Arsenate reductase related protein [Prochlorococcus sp. MIT 0603]
MKSKNINYKLIDIIETPPSKDTLVKALNQLGDRKYLFNTSGKSYRAIGAASIRRMSDDDVIKLLASDGKLIKRPFVINNDGRIITGFNQLSWEELFLSLK